MKMKIIKSVIIILAAVVVIGCLLGFVITPETASPLNSAVDGIKPFSSASEIGSNYYRIPAVITAADGTLVASADARFGGTKDSANNIDTAVSLSNDGGESWSEPTLALSFDDWENSSKILKENGSLGTKNSASLIDTALLQDKNTGRIFMLVDAFPCATGVSNSQQGSGYGEIDGQKRLLLKKDGDKDYNYYVGENGVICSKDGKETEYSLNSKYEVLENSQPLTVKQKELKYWYNFSFGVNTKTEVPMNIMYKNSLFKPLPTSYLYLVYSDDSGKTWSDPVDLNQFVKPEDECFMGVCPGRGIQIENGKYAGRLIFAAYFYDTETGKQRFTTIYSDDGGKTWQAGEGVTPNETIDNFSETQLVQFKDGSLQSFSRTTVGKVASSFSLDGGVTWSSPAAVDELPLTGGSGCQLSVINYEGKIDGKDAVILSAPAMDERKNGFVYVGLISESKDPQKPYNIEWKYRTEITDKDTYFAYSCLTQLENGSIGLLYEQANTPQTVDTMIFKTYTISELCKTEYKK